MVAIKLTNVISLIFDFDGVIAETDNGRFALLNNILKEYKIELEESYDVTDIIGRTSDNILRTYFPQLSEESIKEIVMKRKYEFLKHLDKYCHVYPEAIQTITDLHAIGKRLYIATTNNLEITEKLLDFIMIKNKFEKIFTRETIVSADNHFKNYSYIIKSINEDKETCIVIEDSALGIESAKRADLFCVAIDRYDNQGACQKADITVKDFNQLRNLLNLKNIAH